MSQQISHLQWTIKGEDYEIELSPHHLKKVETRRDFGKYYTSQIRYCPPEIIEDACSFRERHSCGANIPLDRWLNCSFTYRIRNSDAQNNI